MTPFFLRGKDARTMDRDLFHHEETSTHTSYPSKHLTRLVSPSRYPSRHGPTYAPESYSERLLSWFTSRSSRHTCPTSYAADAAHRSLAIDLSTHNPHFAAQRYTDCYAAYYPGSYHDLHARCVKTREVEYEAVLKKNRADAFRGPRRDDEVLFVRKKGWRDEGGGWKRTGKEVEWLRGRRWV